MVAVPFPVSSAPGAHPQEGAGRLINAYAVRTPQGSRAPMKWPRSPGLHALVADVGYAHYRGFIEVNGAILAVLRNRVVSIARSGNVFAVTDLGALAGGGLVTLAKNNAATPHIVAVTENGCFNLFPNMAPTDFADPDLPQPNSVSVLKGYFIWTIADGRIFASDLNAVAVNSLSYTTAQGRSDGLLRGVAHRGEFFAFGTSSCEVYREAGLTPFPLEFVTMIPRGLAGPHAVAGWEEGWSNELVWAADDDVVYQLEGYSPVPVSNEDVSRAIAATPDKSVLGASVYMSAGNAFWALTRPGFWTWELNITTKCWNERRSYARPCWRVGRTVKAFSTWLAGDRDSGALFEISADAYREGEDPLVFEVESGAIAVVPKRLQVPRLDVDMTAAVGQAEGEEPIETEPRAEIVWSHDGGYRFGLPVQRPIGGEGESQRTVSVNRLGACTPKGFKIRLRVSDPVPVTLFGAEISGVEQRAAE